MKAVPMIDIRHLAAVLTALVVSSAAIASPELARSKNCVACHHAERRMNGPPYKEIAARYANDDSALERLSQKVLQGGAGNWGQSPMPPQSTLSQEEVEALVRWILSHQ
jgi:cytochrome c